MAAIAATLSRYPEHVITAVTHPATGLPTKKKWLPTVQEVYESCEEIYEPIIQRAARDRRIAEQLALRRQVELERLEPRPTYDDLKAKYGPNWGMPEPSKRVIDPEAEKRASHRNEMMKLDEYAALGIEPQYTKSGDLISPSLVLQIKQAAE